MVKKADLLQDLQNDLNFEEDLVVKLSDFYKVMGWKNSVHTETCKTMLDNLSILKKDSEKHAALLREMAVYIKGAGKDEF